jgi:hypothetical protein
MKKTKSTIGKLVLLNQLDSRSEVKNCKTVKWSSNIEWLLKLMYGDAGSDNTASFQIPKTIRLRYE